MSLRTDTFDLGGLRLSAGEGRRLELTVGVDPFMLGGERYAVEPDTVPVRLDISRTTGDGYALRLRAEATLIGPCMRCLEPARPRFSADAREVSQGDAARTRRGGDLEELASPYVERGVLDVRAWTRDAFALVLPAKLLCRPDCAGLCPACGVDLNAAGSEHGHEREVQAHWAKLSELRFE
jgi:uncharacterized protein